MRVFKVAVGREVWLSLRADLCAPYNSRGGRSNVGVGLFFQVASDRLRLNDLKWY